MRITQQKEHDGGFWFSLEAENIEEAAFITRVGINRTQKIEAFVNCYQSGEFVLSVRLQKCKRSDSTIKPRTGGK